MKYSSVHKKVLKGTAGLRIHVFWSDLTSYFKMDSDSDPCLNIKIQHSSKSNFSFNIYWPNLKEIKSFHWKKTVKSQSYWSKLLVRSCSGYNFKVRMRIWFFLAVGSGSANWLGKYTEFLSTRNLSNYTVII